MNTKKIVAMLALSLLLGGGAVGITKVKAQNNTINNTVQTQEGLSEQEESKKEEKKGNDIEKDGIDHQFEGEEQHED